jgi:hypothetical protein
MGGVKKKKKKKKTSREGRLVYGYKGLRLK